MYCYLGKSKYGNGLIETPLLHVCPYIKNSKYTHLIMLFKSVREIVIKLKTKQYQDNIRPNHKCLFIYTYQSISIYSISGIKIYLFLDIHDIFKCTKL